MVNNVGIISRKWILEGHSEDGYSVASICEGLKDQFYRGYAIGEESKQWAIDNLSHDYFFVMSQYDNDLEYFCEQIILICNEADAVAFKLRWI